MPQAMIFAAGLGTRLRPLTDDRPKALVEVEGRTLLEHTILRLKDAGFARIVVNVHHFADQIIDFLKAHDHFGLDIRVSDERNQLLDTGGGVKAALPLIAGDEPLLIHNVDIVSTIDLLALYSSHIGQQERTAATLAINQRKTSRYLMFDDALDLSGWTNISTGEVKGKMGEKYAFAGIHVIDPTLLPALMAQPEDSFPIVPFYLSVCGQMRLHGQDVTAYKWEDCGKVESLAHAAAILRGR